MPISDTFNSPDISVVIPTYNRSHLIKRAIDTVKNQTKHAAEIIIVDDGSTDRTEEIVKSLGGGVRYIHQKNSGAASARNRGVRASRFEWVAFLDSDDLWVDGHLERMSRAIVSTAGQALFYFSDVIMSAPESGKRLWELCEFSIDGEFELKLDATDWVMKRWPPMLLQASVFNRSAYLQRGGLWEKLRTREDTHFFLKVGIGNPLCAVAGCGTKMTADDLPENRLTASHVDQKRSGYEMRAMVFEDILKQHRGNLQCEHRRNLQGRLAQAYRSLARLSWNEGSYVAAAYRLGRSFLVSPQSFLKKLIG